MTSTAPAAAPPTPLIKNLPLAAAISAQFLWAAGNVIVAHLDFPSEQLAVWRLGMAAVVYLAVLTMMGRRLTASDLRISLLGGLSFATNLGLFYTALQLTSVANAVVISALQPALVAVVASRLFGERLDGRAVIAVAVAFTGVALVVFGATGAREWNIKGDLLALGGTVMWAVYFIGSKQAREKLGAFEYQTALLLIATVAIMPLPLIVHGSVGSPSGSLFGWIALLVLLPGSGHLVMNWALHHLPVTVSSTLTLSVPVLSTIGAWIFLGQELSGVQAAGIAVVLVAMTYFVRTRALANRVA